MSRRYCWLVIIVSPPDHRMDSSVHPPCGAPDVTGSLVIFNWQHWGIIIGSLQAIENYLDGSQNARILDRINHEAVQVYYDVYNTGLTKGHDVPGDIHLLKGRIAQFHFKNGPDYLDNGKLKLGPIATAIKAIGYRGWIVLETSSPSKDAVADVRRNAEFARGLFK